MRLIVFVILLCSGAGAVHADTVVFDFNDPSIDTRADGFEPLITNGFEFATGSESIANSGITSGFLSWGTQGTLEISAVNGSSFDLLSLDFGSWAENTDLSVVGHYAEGGTVQIDFTSGDSFALTSLTMDSSWNGLNRVSLDAGFDPGGVDNIVITTAVPIPAAIWLLGSALAGLGWLRRKQTA